MARFDLLPAVDLRGGRVVRLRRGDFGAETAYGDDPVAVAEAFVAAGARWLHVVDLDAARDGRSTQAAVVERIVAAVGERCSVEVAGGLRTARDVRRVLDGGAARAVVGTAALEDPALAGSLVEAHGPDRVAIALDVRDGLAVGHGWVPGAAGIPVEAALVSLSRAGVRWFEVTAIDRDGTLGGPDLELLAAATAHGTARIIASGGIRSVADIEAVRGMGCHGAIVGRAIYDGSLRLEAALEAAGS
jgi:phosphoribosylformimino-5-aminoimidazole carboxamide ribotide isomerase